MSDFITTVIPKFSTLAFALVAFFAILIAGLSGYLICLYVTFHNQPIISPQGGTHVEVR
jgi:hypothetical protein